MPYGSFIPLISGLLLAPLVLGIINRTKAKFAGRNGQPLLQVYFDLWRLLHKGAVYSRSTTWVFRLGPLAGLAAMITALTLAPLGGVRALVWFPGDLVLLALLLGVVRFTLIIAALDTASAFEGMGASREAAYAALVEPAFFLALAALARFTHSMCLTDLYASISAATWAQAGPALALVAITFLGVFLVENARIPVDDPTTHLELTMIHEVMILDHSGPDFAFLEYAAALKHWLLGALLAGILVPVRSGNVALDAAACIVGIGVIAVVVGIIESTMARLRLPRVPELIVGAAALAAVAFVVVGR